jgi:hypothetical protein
MLACCFIGFLTLKLSSVFNATLSTFCFNYYNLRLKVIVSLHVSPYFIIIREMFCGKTAGLYFLGFIHVYIYIYTYFISSFYH